jgi:hypothetical protein
MWLQRETDTTNAGIDNNLREKQLTGDVCVVFEMKIKKKTLET